MDIISSLAHVTPLTAYTSVFFLMVANGATNLPSSQLLYIFVGFLTTKGTLSIYILAVCGGLGNALGNIFLYEIVKAKGAGIVKRFFSIESSKEEHIRALLEKQGALYIFLGKLIPGVKVFIPVIAGLTNIKRSLVYSTLTISSIIWAIIFLHIGAFFGTNTTLTKWYGIFAVFALLGLYFYTYKKHPHLFKALRESNK
jgi:membrane protein DedA with SNARE-associated domain